MPSVQLLLGSNLSDRAALLSQARHLISQRVGDIVRSTTEVETEAVGYISGNLYLNQILVVQTELRPIQVLDTTQAIEREMGRVGRSSRLEPYSDRSIDIDLLYYHEDGDSSEKGLELSSERLILPHPEIENRDFTLNLLRML